LSAGQDASISAAPYSVRRYNSAPAHDGYGPAHPCDAGVDGHCRRS
jgi:hypothetical protein